nr:MAG TPA: hypothetical protein [Caudoviricetes sp.]
MPTRVGITEHDTTLQNTIAQHTTEHRKTKLNV